MKHTPLPWVVSKEDLLAALVVIKREIRTALLYKRINKSIAEEIDIIVGAALQKARGEA